MGGISGVYNKGAQVDNVRELEVVTGEGEVKRCSLAQNRDLFEAALGGLGQCAIITRATVDLVPARQLARLFLVNYTDNATFFADYRRILNRGEFDQAFNMWIPDGAGGLIYQLNLVKYYDPSDPPTTITCCAASRRRRWRSSTCRTWPSSWASTFSSTS